MDEEILLPNSRYININLGLKYLNGNKKLYLKILNSFLTRYKYFNITSIEEDELKNEMHTLKGLSSTLGMESLSNLAKNLHNEQNEELIVDFSKTLKCIIIDLSKTQTKTLLIIDNNSDDINSLMEMLESNYDIMVIRTPSDDLESIKRESIDMVLLNPELSNDKLKHILEQKKIYLIELYKPIDLNSLKLAIETN
jgi:HPt (histidine-containing phosphotransfer) domain-containing protein